MNQNMPKPAFGEPYVPPAERTIASPVELGMGYGVAATPAPAPASDAPPPMTVAQMVRAYRQLRDRKQEIEAQHDLELKPFKDMLKTLDIAILEALNNQGTNSVRTDDGTAFKVTRTSYTVSDPKAFRDYIESIGNVDLMETRASKSAIEEHIKNGGALPPGIKVSSDVTINVRKG